jgi:hypothetical protein
MDPRTFEREKALLIARLDAARGALDARAADLRASLDVAARVKSSFRAHPVTWFAGAAGVGIALATALRGGRRKTGHPPKSAAGRALPPRAAWVGVAAFALRSVFQALQPAIVAAVREWLARRHRGAGSA